MKTYEKPLILTNEELMEGIYACSGGGTNVCKSIYMKGIYHRNTRWENIHPGDDSDSKHTEIERGCEGCPYNWGECAVNFSNAQPGQDSRPGWERKGYKPTDPYSWGA
jgi:hypothetical protein